MIVQGPFRSCFQIARRLPLRVSIACCFALAGCGGDDPVQVINAANRLLQSKHVAEAPLTVGDLFDHHDGLVCIVQQDLHTLEFSRAAKAWGLKSEVSRAVSRLDHNRDYVYVHLFDANSRLARTQQYIWRHRILDIDSSDGADLDICYRPTDVADVRLIDGRILIRLRGANYAG